MRDDLVFNQVFCHGVYVLAGSAHFPRDLRGSGYTTCYMHQNHRLGAVYRLHVEIIENGLQANIVPVDGFNETCKGSERLCSFAAHGNFVKLGARNIAELSAGR